MQDLPYELSGSGNQSQEENNRLVCTIKEDIIPVNGVKSSALLYWMMNSMPGGGGRGAVTVIPPRMFHCRSLPDPPHVCTTSIARSPDSSVVAENVINMGKPKSLRMPLSTSSTQAVNTPPFVCPVPDTPANYLDFHVRVRPASAKTEGKSSGAVRLEMRP